MARTTERLNALRVERAKRPGMYPDGGGLYLQVTEGGASWIYRYMLGGRAREMGLGPLALIGLSEARAKALDARRLRHEGVDPIEARKTERAKARLEETQSITFKQCTQTYIAAHRAGWKNEKHAAQWQSTLETYAYPIIGALSVQAIDTGLVLRVIEPIWSTKPETAGRVRGRVEAILDWATVRGFRKGENPARWRGHLAKLLPARSKVRKVKPHPALPYSEAPAFLASLRAQEGIAARALEFTILTAARTNETIDAKPAEFSLAEKVWTVPPERMKADREHRVPLSDVAIQIIRPLLAHARPDGFMFPGAKPGRPLSNMAMNEVIRRMNAENTKAGRPRWLDPKQSNKDVVPHGFRSTFDDWASETTGFPEPVIDMCLAHKISNKTKAAYRRGDLFEKRRRLMAAWAEFLSKTSDESGKVVALRRS